MTTKRWNMTASWMMAVGTMFVLNASAGSLTPPGPPGATMHTLTEIHDRAEAAQTAAEAAEPRTAITNLPWTISQSGSYYLAGTLIGGVTGDGITVTAPDVTIDLNGFALLGAGASNAGRGIYGDGDAHNLRIVNGTVAGWGNGWYGIHVDGDRTIVENVRAERNGGGIMLRDDARVANSTAAANGGGGGILARHNAVVENSRAMDNMGHGIYAWNGATVRGCTVFRNSGSGIELSINGRIVDNTSVDNGNGLRITGSGSYTADNIVRGNTVNYDIAQGNQLNLLLCEIPETLNWPCSVRLAGTLSTKYTGVDGITVAANDVTIDMAGHALVGPGESSGHGIYQSGDYRNLRVFNGKAIEWQGNSKYGIYAYGTGAILSDLQVSTNSHGIYTGSGCTISDCTARGNTGNGIVAGSGSTLSGCAAHYNSGSYGIAAGSGSTLSGCVANYNSGSYGIYAGNGSTLSGCAASYNGGTYGIYAGNGSTLSGCAAYYNSGSYGIYAGSGSTISGCAASFTGNDGIRTESGSTISGCVAQYNTGNGIRVYSDSRVVDCVSRHNGFGDGDGAGIYATSSDNRIEGNNCTDNDRGIHVTSGGNFIVKNSCSGNTLNWEIAAGNVCLVVNAATAGAISGNSGGTAPGSTDPNANFTY